jgi:hypothetical protein
MMWPLTLDAWALGESPLLNPDFRDILSEFSAAGVDFLLVGAYALAVHGLPRATGDIDLWVRPSPENAQRSRPPWLVSVRQWRTSPPRI